MSSGVFGTVRPANIDPSNDVEILYHFTPTAGQRGGNGYQHLSPSECLLKATEDDDNGTVINGLYKLRLPVTVFICCTVSYILCTSPRSSHFRA